MNKPTLPEIEKRTFAKGLRAAQGDEMALVGVAASFNTPSPNNQGFREVIAPGAFALSLAAPDSDVKCLINHDPSLILGRQKNGTLRVWEDASGLNYRCQLDPTNTSHRDFYASIKRGDIDECSFAFMVPDGGDIWDEMTDPETNQPVLRRTLRNLNLMDVSAVTYPYYSTPGATAVQARQVATGDAARKARAEAIGKQIFADRLAAAAETVAADKRAHMDNYDVSSAREAMALDDALKAYGYRLVSCTDEHAYGVPEDYDGDGDPENEDCTRWGYKLDKDGHVTLDHANREVFHGWVKNADQDARARYVELLPFRRHSFETKELKRRMRSAAGIFS